MDNLEEKTAKKDFSLEKAELEKELKKEIEKELSDFEIDDEIKDSDFFNFEELEEELREEVDNQLSELIILEENKEKIGNPESLGEIIKDVVWEQFINQIGVTAGKDFIKKNNGLTLDLRDKAHIQTPENFAEGKLATHNYQSKEQLEQNYKRYKNTPHKSFRKKHVNKGMNSTLERAGELNKKGIETVTDIYTGRQIPTAQKLENGKNNPKAAQREHVKPSEKIYQNPSLQMANDDKELASIINHPENLQGYTTAERNNRKSNNLSNEMEERDKNKHWEKANERAEQHIKKEERKGEDRLKKEGRETQRAEAFKMGGEALKAFVMVLLTDLVRKIIQQLVIWLQSAERSINTFLESVKTAITEFVENLKQEVLSATDIMVTTIVTAIFGPIVRLIKKAWIFLKQGAHTIKEAIQYLKNPENSAKPFEIIMMEVGKIVIVGLSAAGALVLGQVIESALMTIPFFALEIPLLGSMASIFGIFLGALISGIVGALALRIIDNAAAKYQLAQIRVQEDALYTQVTQKEAVLAQVIALKTGTPVAQTEVFFVNTAVDMSGKREQTISNQEETLLVLEETEKSAKRTKENIDELLNDNEEEFNL